MQCWPGPLWHLAILRAQSRLSWFETVDFTRELSPQVGPLNFTCHLSRCLSRRRFDFDLGPVDKVMESRDLRRDADDPHSKHDFAPLIRHASLPTC